MDVRTVKRVMLGRGGAPLRLAYRGAVSVELAAVTAFARLRRGPDDAERAETAPG